VRDLLRASWVDVTTLRVVGAETVAIQRVADPPLGRDRSELAGVTDRDAVNERIGAAIVAYLRAQTGHDLWTVSVAVDKALAHLVEPFAASLVVSGGQSPWTGRQRFALSIPERTQPVRVYATVERQDMVVVAVRPIAAGDFVRAADVELQSLSGGALATAVHSLTSAIGKEATQPIRAGAAVLGAQLRSPLLVRRGELVSVRARAAGVVVRTYATAQQDGSLGDLVQVLPLTSKERYAARVSGVRELEVFAAGVAAEDLATAER
jgi:flagella basal body P-ring formation protein FlgA